MTMTDPVCPETGVPLHPDLRPLASAYEGESLTIDMPGWYGDQVAESIHTAADMKVSDRALNRLKARVEGLLEPGAIRRIRKRLGLTQEQAAALIGWGAARVPEV